MSIISSSGCFPRSIAALKDDTTDFEWTIIGDNILGGRFVDGRTQSEHDRVDNPVSCARLTLQNCNYNLVVVMHRRTVESFSIHRHVDKFNIKSSSKMPTSRTVHEPKKVIDGKKSVTSPMTWSPKKFASYVHYFGENCLQGFHCTENIESEKLATVLMCFLGS